VRRGGRGPEGGESYRTLRLYRERSRERDARSRLRVERWDREGDTVALGPVGVGLSRAPSQFSDSRRVAVSSVVNYYIHIYILYLLYYFNVRRVPFTVSLV
jgi:hypothetical protein